MILFTQKNENQILTQGTTLSLHLLWPVLWLLDLRFVLFFLTCIMAFSWKKIIFYPDQWHTQEFCSGEVQQIQLRTEDRENGDLGAAAP